MKATIAGLKDHVAEVTLSGWVYHNRPSGKVLFLVIRDGTGLCQCVIEKSKVADELFDAVSRLGQESSLRVTGLVRAEPRSPAAMNWPPPPSRSSARRRIFPSRPRSTASSS